MLPIPPFLTIVQNVCYQLSYTLLWSTLLRFSVDRAAVLMTYKYIEPRLTN